MSAHSKMIHAHARAELKKLRERQERFSRMTELYDTGKISFKEYKRRFEKLETDYQ